MNIVKARERWEKRVGYHMVRECCHVCYYSQAWCAYGCLSCMRVGGMAVKSTAVCKYFKLIPPDA